MVAFLAALSNVWFLTLGKYGFASNVFFQNLEWKHGNSDGWDY